MDFWTGQWVMRKSGFLSSPGLCFRIAYLLVISWLTLGSCVSTLPATTEQDKHVATELYNTDGQVLGQKRSGDAQGAGDKMKEYLDNGLEKIFQGSYSEGISQLVTVLAEMEKLSNPSPEALETARQAEMELTKLSAALALEADTVWLDSAMNQRMGSSVDITLQPAVILTIVQPTGRSLVSNAPVDFQFVKGSGIISGQVNTNSLGFASCNIARFQNPAMENIIQASLVYRIKGFTYRFKGVECRFMYVPPLKKATVLVLEKSPEGVSTDPFILDPVFQRLKKIDYDLSLFNGVMAPNDFTLVYEGNKTVIQKMGLEEGVSYLVIIYSECPAVRQMELDGKKYNIFMADARATVRIIRVSDGKIMYQVSVERSKARNTHGQGGSESRAIQDVLHNVADDMAMKVEGDLSGIKAILGS